MRNIINYKNNKNNKKRLFEIMKKNNFINKKNNQINQNMKEKLNSQVQVDSNKKSENEIISKDNKIIKNIKNNKIKNLKKNTYEKTSISINSEKVYFFHVVESNEKTIFKLNEKDSGNLVKIPIIKNNKNIFENSKKEIISQIFTKKLKEKMKKLIEFNMGNALNKKSQKSNEIKNENYIYNLKNDNTIIPLGYKYNYNYFLEKYKTKSTLDENFEQISKIETKIKAYEQLNDIDNEKNKDKLIKDGEDKKNNKEKNMINKIIFQKDETKEYNISKNYRCRKGRYKINSLNILFLIFSFLFITFTESKIKLSFSLIELIIKGPGISKIYHSNESDPFCPVLYYPNKININEEIINNISEYNFDKPENHVVLSLDDNINSLKCLFYSCSNIIKINFSNFDSNKVIDMSYLFYSCTSLISVDFTNYDSSNVLSMNYLFFDCISLTDIKFSNFNTSKVKYMDFMFAYCKILTEIDLSKFDTSEVINMHGMFQGCESLIFINLSNFNTSNTVEFGALFYLCTKLISVDISNFDTENAVSIGSIFRECNSLISVNLSHFKTSKVTNMDFMFYKCEKLTSLDLSNFDTSSVTWIESAFDGCTSLEYINMKNAIENEKQLINCDNLFRDVPDNIVICLNELYTPNFTRQIQEKKCYINDCSDDWESKHLKRVDGFRCIFNNYFIHKNTNTEEYKFCSCKHCKDNYYPIENDKSNNNTHIYCYNNPEGYYLDKDDLNHNIYKPCYHICQKDLSDGKEKNNRCTSLNKEFPFILMDKDNYDNNCSNNFTYYFYIDNANNYFFTNSFSCPDQYPKLIKEKRECIKNCDLSDNYKYEFHNICYNQCPKNSKSSIENIYICKEMCDEDKPYEIIETHECVDYCDLNQLLSEKCKLQHIDDIIEENNETIIKDEKEIKEKEIKAQDKLLKNVEEGFTSDKYDTTNLENGKDDIIQDNKLTITLTTSDNQKKNENNNMTTIDLGDCEYELRLAYNISKDNKIYMKKIDMKQDGLKIPKVEYDVYCKLNGTNLVKLNLTFCKNTKIALSVPVVITDSLDKYDPNSGYYNDICYTATSDEGIDISLNDRKNDFIKDGKIVCQEGCDFTKYDDVFHKAKCSCDVKESSESSAFMNINTTEIFNNFIDIKNIANFHLLICNKVLFTKDGIIHNISFYLMIFIILFHIICIIIFYGKQFNKLKTKIKEIIFGLKYTKLIKLNEIPEEINKFNKSAKKEIIEVKNNKRVSISKIKKNGNKENIQKIKIHSPINVIYPNKKNKKYHHNPPLKKKRKSTYKILKKNHLKIDNMENNFKKSKTYRKESNPSSLRKIDKIKDQKINNKVNKIMKYNIQELINLPYKLALKYKHYSFCQYYFMLLKIKHILIFSFYNNDDYNSRIIKIDLFFISFVIYYAVNALFFNDDTMHKIYENKGKYQFVYQLPKIIYSSLISIIFNTLLKLLALSEGDILKLKRDKNIKDLKKKKIDVNKKLFVKFLFYFILSFILIFFIWYYLSVFGAIYKNTQIHLIKDTLISFGLSLLYPFGIYLLPVIFRIASFSKKKIKNNNKTNYLYTISQVLQII